MLMAFSLKLQTFVYGIFIDAIVISLAVAIH